MDLSTIYPPRNLSAHKGNFGNVMVVGGSKLYTGAASLAAVAALRAGADMVTVCAPARAANVASLRLPDLMTFPLKGDSLTTRHINDILDTAHVRKINCFVIGMGLGRHPSTFEAIYKLISKITVPMVLDADALRAIARKPEVVFGKQVILTPHPGELALLRPESRASEGQAIWDFDQRLVAAKQAAYKYRAVVLSKGNVDIVTDGATTITNNSGTPFMTKGGFGDTLAGICGALLARGVGVIEAALAAAYINGRAGELAADKNGEGTVASDIFDFIPQVISAS
ncbi:MAG: NAD(P)H-hydrate dehydratase, partial [Candidatus Curtissbacteria bacterium]